MSEVRAGFRRVGAGRGWRWIAEAFTLFRRNPLIWIVLVMVLLGLGMMLALLPMIGSYLLYLLAPLLLAGLMTAARDTDAGAEIEIAHVFAGFRHNAAQLVTLGGVYLVGNLLLTMLALSLGGSALQEVMQAARDGTMDTVSAEVLNRASMAGLVYTALLVPLGMALWFAPALVILDDVPAWQALRLSFLACLTNLLPFLLYGVIMLALLLVAASALVVGVMLWLPLAVISGYTSYRDVFGQRGPAPTPQ